ncbi:MAG: hypothetical protein EBV20_03945 [Betaproteobacteria bacterium]|jgi:cytochrome c553|nr:hypothetical protein [Betaproteobacteria bacterium]NBP44029.1 hypothetical protein [Betaproteobacteria bacterium]
MPRFHARLLTLALGWCAFTAASEPLIFKGADVVRGQQLMAEARCEACHARNVGGDGTDIYNPAGKIKTAGLLRGMVEYCSTQLNLGFFPEDSTDVAAALNRLHYRFKD